MRFLGDLLKPVSLVVLRNAALLEAAVIAAVVLADAGLPEAAPGQARENPAPAWHHRYPLTVLRANGMYHQRSGRLCTSGGNARISMR